jgi:flavin-dependent dehydrogenase
MRRPAWVVPRRVFDERLVRTAVGAGAQLRRHRVREIERRPGEVVLDREVRARVVVGADGAHSLLRRRTGAGSGRSALALRGYAPVAADRAAEQRIAFGTGRYPSYAWSFDCGDGTANVGYGELLHPARVAPTRPQLLDRLEELLPGATEGGTGWRGHHLPLSGARWSHPAGRVLLAGDAAGLVNPLTGEGIYYAVATGALAGQVAAAAPPDPGRAYRVAVRDLLGSHLRHTALAGRLVAAGSVLDAGMRAAAGDQRVFDDLVELGLGRGRITGRTAGGIAGRLAAYTLTGATGRREPPPRQPGTG